MRNRDRDQIKSRGHRQCGADGTPRLCRLGRLALRLLHNPPRTNPAPRPQPSANKPPTIPPPKSQLSAPGQPHRHHRKPRSQRLQPPRQFLQRPRPQSRAPTPFPAEQPPAAQTKTATQSPPAAQSPSAPTPPSPPKPPPPQSPTPVPTSFAHQHSVVIPTSSTLSFRPTGGICFSLPRPAVFVISPPHATGCPISRAPLREKWGF